MSVEEARGAAVTGKSEVLQPTAALHGPEKTQIGRCSVELGVPR